MPKKEFFLFFVQQGYSLHSQHFLQVLGSLIKGSGVESFLTEEAIGKVFSILQGSVSRNDVREPEPAVLSLLQQCLFTLPVWRPVKLPGSEDEGSALPPQMALTQYIYAHSEVCPLHASLCLS